MRGSEVHALGTLAGQAVGRPARLAGDIHSAAAGRTFKALGILGAPVKFVHDGISNAAYRVVTSALGAPVRAGAAALGRTFAPDALPMADSPRGSIALGALNGAFGDALARDHRELSLELSVRRGGREVVTDSEGLASEYPEATPKIAVFVHGLCETEAAWHIGARPGYGYRLREELGYTPVDVRYNTGLHVSDNGRRLAQVLDHLVLAWPVEVEEIALIGHSMGGLVSRSACRYGESSDHGWTEHVRHVFCLGTPHLGAPMEKAANLFGWALARLPETRPFADLVNVRSAGIKDLRYGSCVEEDWCDCDPDEFLRDRCNEVPFLPNATYYFVGATLARRAEGPYASLVGDLLVRYPSASGIGRKRRIPFEIDNGVHLGGLTHFHLLNHPAVYEQLRTWLRRDPARTSAA
jgi:pimeloyl-ACP methyl ester carboxylesterase